MLIVEECQWGRAEAIELEQGKVIVGRSAFAVERMDQHLDDVELLDEASVRRPSFITFGGPLVVDAGSDHGRKVGAVSRRQHHVREDERTSAHKGIVGEVKTDRESISIGVDLRPADDAALGVEGFTGLGKPSTSLLL